MIVYISGPITNDPDYKKKFEEAEMRLSEQGYRVINPASLDLSASWEECMKISLQLIDLADAIYLLEGWRKSRGSQIEYRHAYRNNLQVITE